MRFRPTAVEWSELSASYDSKCIETLRPLLEEDGLVELTEESLASSADADVGDARALLRAVEGLGIFLHETRWSCGCCEEDLNAEEAAQAVCPYCNEAFKDCPGGVREKELYIRTAARGRDPAWIMVLHGMNTCGKWQEELSWLSGQTYERSLPVLIHKYGKVRPGVMLRWRQRQLVHDLAVKMETLFAKYRTLDNSPPDVIAHSFGSWLLGHVLLEHPEFLIGRIILAGCILRPDFDWDVLVQRGQIEAVLNHCGSKDQWVPRAHWIIPESGPSGVRGFVGASVVHRVEESFGHSSFFEEAHMESNYRQVWDVFLRRPSERLGELARGTPLGGWRSAPRGLREVIRLGALAVAALLGTLLAASTVVGIVTLTSTITD